MNKTDKKVAIIHVAQVLAETNVEEWKARAVLETLAERMFPKNEDDELVAYNHGRFAYEARIEENQINLDELLA